MSGWKGSPQAAYYPRLSAVAGDLYGLRYISRGGEFQLADGWIGSWAVTRYVVGRADGFLTHVKSQLRGCWREHIAYDIPLTVCTIPVVVV